MTSIVLDTQEKRNAFAIIQLKAQIGLYHKTDGRMIPFRGWTISKAMSTVQALTGKKFTRTEKGRAECLAYLASLLPTPELDAAAR